MIDVFIEAANGISRPWMVWILSSLLDSSLLLVAMTLLWWAIRRHTAPQVGYILFLLIPLKLILPLNVAAPSVIARMAPSVIIGRWMESFDNHSVTKIDDMAEAAVQTTPTVQLDSAATVIPRATAIPITTTKPETVSTAYPQDASEHSRQRPSGTTAISPLRYEAMLMIGWTCIVVALLGRLVLSQVRFRTRTQSLQNSVCLPSGIDLHSLCQRAGVHQDVQLAVSDQVTVPAVFGIARPVILLPHTIAATLSTQQLQWVLLHELAHIRRRDLLVVAFQNLVTALQFFNPAIWIANRIIHQLREYACDDLAVALNNGSAVDPGEAFLAILRQANQRPQNHYGALGIFGLDPRSACFDRIRRLMDTDRPLHTKLHRRSVFALLLVAVAVLPRLYAANDALDPPATKTVKSAEHPTKTMDEPLAKDVGEFRLLVINADEKPIPTANIEFRVSPIPTSEQVRLGTFIRKGSYGAFIATNTEGQIVLTYPNETNSFNVSIQIPGYAPYWAGWSSQNHPEPVPAKFTAKLQSGWSVGAIVVDAEGKPIPGAQVRPSISFLKRTGDTSQLGIGTRIKTDEAGRWQFDSTPSSKDEVWVEISHPDFKPLRRALSRSEFGIGQGQEPLGKIVLDHGLTVTGTVTDDSGNPIADALVRTKFINDIRQTTTKPDGSYTLSGCESRVAKIVVSAKGRAIDMKELRIVPEMEPVNFELTHGRSVRVRVLDKKDQPIPKARILFQKWRGDSHDYFEFNHVNQYADEHGVWEWNEAPVDGFQADICHPNGMYLSHQPLIARGEDYVFRVPGPLVITGNVIDATTKLPLKKFDVVPGFRFDNGELYWDQKTRFTATDGKYRLQQLDGRMAYLVRIEASGYRTEVSRDIKPDEENTTVGFELKPARDITGVVVAPDGTPAVGARIAVAIAGTQLNIRNGDFGEVQTSCLIEQTDEAGRFRVPPQDKGCELFIVHPAGFAQFNAESVPERIPLEKWARVEGVFRIAGKPVSGVPISIEGIGPHSRGDDVSHILTGYRTTTKEDGRYAIERVFPGHGWVGREIVMMVVEGALDVTSAYKIPVDLKPGETTEASFGESGRPVTGRLIASDANAKVDWKQILVQVESVLPVLPPLGEIPFPPNIAADVKKRWEWFRKWQETDEGQAWTRLKNAHDANQQLRNTRPHFRATLNVDGTFRIDDVPEGDYTIGPLFGGIGHRFSVPPIENGRLHQEIDLGELKLLK